MRRRSVALVAVSLTLAGCGGASAGAAGVPGEFPVTLDSCGKQVTIEAPPERVLTSGTDAVDLVVAAGGADRIAARAAEFGQPLRGPARAVEDVPVLDEEAGGQGELSAETIIGAGVDLVVYNSLDEGVIATLAEAGIPALRLSGICDGPDDRAEFADIYTDIQRYGQLFGTEDVAAASVADLQDRVAAVGRQAEGGPARSAASILIFEGVIYPNAARSMGQAQMDVLGLTNVYGDVDQAYIEANIEGLIDRDPDVLILAYGYLEGEDIKTFEDAKAEFLALPGVADMSAVRNDHIVGLLARDDEPGVAAVYGVEHLATELAALD